MSKTVLDRAASMREFALSFPETSEHFPWGERVIKVKNKVFVFLGKAEDRPETLSFSVKLPLSGPEVLGLQQAVPTGYGLGKSGWVTFRFPGAEAPPIELLHHWIEESYRAVAPKSVSKLLDSLHPAGTTSPSTRSSKSKAKSAAGARPSARKVAPGKRPPSSQRPVKKAAAKTRAKKIKATGATR